ncbi:MAG: hypothetical protein MJ252_03080 [archaeon]|nr:hypothetical protein [archaeon]
MSRGTKALKTNFKPKEILENHQRFLNAKTLLFQTYLNDISADLKDFFHLSKFALMNLSFIKKEDEVVFHDLEIKEEIKPIIIPFLKMIYVILGFPLEMVEKEQNPIQQLYLLSSQKFKKNSLKEIFIFDFVNKVNDLSKDEINNIHIQLSDLVQKNELIFASYMYLPLSQFCSKLANCLKYFFDLLNDHMEKNKIVQALESKIGKFVECSEILKKQKESLVTKLTKSK